MDKEIKAGVAYYHLSGREVAYLRSNGYAHITLWNKPLPDGGRTIGTEADTPLGKRNQKFLEDLMTKAGFSVNEANRSDPSNKTNPLHPTR